MRIEIGDRQTGKTKAMLDWMEEAVQGEVRVCVSHSHKAAMDLFRRSREEGRSLQPWQFIAPDELRSYNPFPVRALGMRVTMGIDDLDLILPNYFTHWPVGMITLRGEHDEHTP